MINGAESDIENAPHRSREMLGQARERISRPDVPETLPTALIDELHGRITQIDAAVAVELKTLFGAARDAYHARAGA